MPVIQPIRSGDLWFCVCGARLSLATLDRGYCSCLRPVALVVLDRDERPDDLTVAARIRPVDAA